MAAKCEGCGKTFKDGRGLAGHRRSGCGTGGAAKLKAAGEGKLGDILRQKAEALREKARQHEETATKLETMAEALDEIGE